MDVTITPCKDGSYCCGNGTFAQLCCDQKEGVYMVNGDAIPYTKFKKAFSTSTEADLQSSASPTGTSLITPPTSITTQSLKTSPPSNSSFPGPPGPSAQSASLTPSSGVIAASVCGICALLIIAGALVFILRKFRPVQPLKSQIRMLNLPPEMLGDDGCRELDGFREFELDRPGNYPEM